MIISRLQVVFCSLDFCCVDVRDLGWGGSRVGGLGVDW